MLSWAQGARGAANSQAVPLGSEMRGREGLTAGWGRREPAAASGRGHGPGSARAVGLPGTFVLAGLGGCVGLGQASQVAFPGS